MEPAVYAAGGPKSMQFRKKGIFPDPIVRSGKVNHHGDCLHFLVGAVRDVLSESGDLFFGSSSRPETSLFREDKFVSLVSCLSERYMTIRKHQRLSSLTGRSTPCYLGLSEVQLCSTDRPIMSRGHCIASRRFAL